jgi:arylsulfatase A-like enzyme
MKHCFLRTLREFIQYEEKRIQMKYDRRHFLKSAGSGVLAMILARCTSSQRGFDLGSLNKPNILLICVDDLRPELGCYGQSHMNTPHLDALAREGITFSHHYIQAPTCGPSRYSLLTGLRPRNDAELNNTFMENNFHNRPETETPETLAHHFRRNGYYTVGIGKISHTPDGRVRGEGQHWELPYSWDEMLCDTGQWDGGFDAFFAYADGESRASMNFEVPPLECGEVGDEGYPDGLNARLAVRKLEELSKANRPFLISVGFFKPHLPFNSPKKYWDLYRREEISLSPNPGLPENTPALFLHPSGEFFNNYKKGKEFGGIGKILSKNYAREIRHAYFAAVSYVDAQIGKVLDALKAYGLHENTIVVVWGDHGWHLGDHTIWGKHSPFERSAHSPLIVKVPGVTKPGSRTGALVETIDIYPTLCELAGIDPPEGLEGQSLSAIFDNPESPGKPAAYCYQKNRISMRTKSYRLIVHVQAGTATVALFDHRTDPFETRNIAADEQETVEKLLPLLKKGNTGILPDFQN